MSKQHFGLPKLWVSTRLGKVIMWGSGGTPSRKIQKYFRGNIPWIKTGELTQKYIYDSQEKISSEAVEKTSAKVFPKDSILIAMYGASIGKISILKTKASTNQACAVGQIYTSYIYNEFLYYYLLSQKHELIQKGQGGAQTNISQGIIKNHDFCLPPLPEQHEIVRRIEAMFSELDYAIASLKKAREQLKTYRQSVLKHAFEGKLTEKWREQRRNAINGVSDLESADKLLEKIKAERQKRYEDQLKEWEKAVEKWEADGKPGKKPKKPQEPKQLPNLEKEVLHKLPELPNNWNWIRLGLLTLKVEYGTSKKSLPSGRIPVLRMGNIQNCIFDWSDLVFSNDDEEIQKYFLEKNDVLFNRTNSPELVGKAAIYQGERPAIFAGYLIRINHFKNLVNSKYLNYFLNSFEAKRYGNEVKTDGVNQSNINGEKLTKYPFPLASFREQNQIVQEIEQRLSVADNLEKSIETSLNKAESLRQSILKKAFEGKLTEDWRKNNPELVTGENSAEKLLEKIKEEQETENKS